MASTPSAMTAVSTGQLLVVLRTDAGADGGQDGEDLPREERDERGRRGDREDPAAAEAGSSRTPVRRGLPRPRRARRER